MRKHSSQRCLIERDSKSVMHVSMCKIKIGEEKTPFLYGN